MFMGKHIIHIAEGIRKTTGTSRNQWTWVRFGRWEAVSLLPVPRWGADLSQSSYTPWVRSCERRLIPILTSKTYREDTPTQSFPKRKMVINYDQLIRLLFPCSQTRCSCSQQSWGYLHRGRVRPLRNFGEMTWSESNRLNQYHSSNVESKVLEFEECKWEGGLCILSKLDRNSQTVLAYDSGILSITKSAPQTVGASASQNMDKVPRSSKDSYKRLPLWILKCHLHSLHEKLMWNVVLRILHHITSQYQNESKWFKTFKQFKTSTMESTMQSSRIIKIHHQSLWTWGLDTSGAWVWSLSLSDRFPTLPAPMPWPRPVMLCCGNRDGPLVWQPSMAMADVSHVLTEKSQKESGLSVV